MTSNKHEDAARIVLKEGRYFSYLDEKFFYQWLESIEGVIQVKGVSQGLCIQLAQTPLSRQDVFDLIALFTRYGYPLAPIRVHLNPSDMEYFEDPGARWFKSLFGTP